MGTEYLKSISICPEIALEKRGGGEPRSDRGKMLFSLVTQNGDVKSNRSGSCREPGQVTLRPHSSCALFPFPIHLAQLLLKTFGARRAFKDRNSWNVKTTAATHCTGAKAATSGGFLQRQSPSKIPDSSRTLGHRIISKGSTPWSFSYAHREGGKFYLYQQAYATSSKIIVL